MRMTQFGWISSSRIVRTTLVRRSPVNGAVRQLNTRKHN